MSKEVRVRLPFKPFPHQQSSHALMLAARFVVLVWHRRAGKTVFAVVELLLAAIACTKERGRFGYISPYLRQSKAVAWEMLKHFAKAIPGCSLNESELWLELPNGARVWLFGADNPDALRGLYFDGICLDEVADMRPEVWGEIIRPALADRQGWAIFIGTPKGINLFSELFYRAQSEKGWAADLKRASDTNVIPPAELDQARREMSAAQYAQEFDCDFSASVENALLRLEDILSAQQRIVANSDYEEEVRVLGVDVARFGDDRTVLFRRQGRQAHPPRCYRGLDTMQTAGEVAAVIDQWGPHATFVDATGVGGGVVDRLGQLGYEVLPVDSAGRPNSGEARFLNRRVEMWWLMAEWLKGGGAIPSEQDLAAELSSPSYKFNSGNKLQLESKADMKKRGLPSPDKADALALTFAAPVAHPALRMCTTNLGAAMLAGTNLSRSRRR